MPLFSGSPKIFLCPYYSAVFVGVSRVRSVFSSSV